MGTIYKKYKNSDIKNKQGGYKARLLFAPIETFLICALPAGGSHLGDDIKILADHTFGNDDGFIEMFGKVNTATAKYTTDDDGVFTHTFQIDIEGESPELYAQLKKMVADSVAGSGPVILLKDGNCIDADSYNQWGDECLQATLKIEFDAKTTASGTKVQTLSGTIRDHRYWYYGTVTEKPEVDTTLVCPVYSLTSTANKVSVIIAGMGTAHHFITKLYSDAAGNNLLQTHTLGATVNGDEFTGLAASTQYYVRVIPVSADGSQLTSCTLQGQATIA